MLRKKGFTLIELLVVIAIVAILMGIIMPAVALARKQATGSRCLGNQRGLVLAWTMYATDSGGKMVGGNTYMEGGRTSYDLWVAGPVGAGGNWNTVASFVGPVPNAGTLSPRERELVGLRVGKLFPYVKNTKSYHCPGDNRGKSSFAFPGNTDHLECYRSYSIPAGLNGERSYCDVWTNVAQIKDSGRKYVFVEDVDPRGYNMGSWAINRSKSSYQWVDPIAIWHNKRSTLSFVDGHAESHSWKDKRTIDWADSLLKGLSFTQTHAGSVDWEYMYQGFTCKNMQP